MRKVFFLPFHPFPPKMVVIFLMGELCYFDLWYVTFLDEFFKRNFFDEFFRRIFWMKSFDFLNFGFSEALGSEYLRSCFLGVS